MDCSWYVLRKNISSLHLNTVLIYRLYSYVRPPISTHSSGGCGYRRAVVWAIAVQWSDSVKYRVQSRNHWNTSSALTTWTWQWHNNNATTAVLRQKEADIALVTSLADNISFITVLLIVDYARQRSINSHGVTWSADLALGGGCVCGNSQRILCMVAEYCGHLSIIVEEITRYNLFVLWRLSLVSWDERAISSYYLRDNEKICVCECVTGIANKELNRF